MAKQFMSYSFLAMAICSLAWSQQQTPSSASPTPQQVAPIAKAKASEAWAPKLKVKNPPQDDRYRIGPGDLLEIRVFDRPQLTRDAVRVDGMGAIRMPLIEHDISTGCLTPSELAEEVASLYGEYLKDPHVDVFIKEYSSEPVSVVGAVAKPGNFQLERRIRLGELLSFAGGPSPAAGRTVQIIHDDNAYACKPTDEAAESASSTGITSVDLYALRQADANMNPYVRPGDLVQVLEADQVYVVGNVYKPQSIPLKAPLTVSRAVAMAGGPLPNTKNNKVRIIRQIPGTMNNQEIVFNLAAIERNKGEDIELQSGDIVDVPLAEFRQMAKGFFRDVTPIVAAYGSVSLIH